MLGRVCVCMMCDILMTSIGLCVFLTMSSITYYQ